MKKRYYSIIAIALIALLALTFTACGKKTATNDTTDDKTEETSRTQTDIYAQLNTMLGKVGYPVTLTSKTTENGYVFSGSYEITQSEGVYTVNYSYEKLSTFGIEDGKITTVPEGFKTTCTGNMKVKGGKIIEQNGAAANLSVEALDVKGLALSETTLSNVKKGNGTFSADIPSLKAVTGMEINARDAKIEIKYADKINQIRLTYSTSSYQSEITYAFS